MTVAMIALFVALSGSAFAAAKLSKNSVTTKAIKNGAVTSKKIKKRSILGSNVRNNTLTGSQINESKLGVVPEAAKVGGIDASNLVTKQQVVQWNVGMNRGDAPRTVATFGPFTLTGRCEVNGANTNAFLDATTSVNDTYVDGDSDFDIGETESITSTTNFASGDRSYTTDEPYFYDPASGVSALDGDGQPMGLWYGFPGADCRFVGSLPFTRP